MWCAAFHGGRLWGQGWLEHSVLCSCCFMLMLFCARAVLCSLCVLVSFLGPLFPWCLLSPPSGASHTYPQVPCNVITTLCVDVFCRLSCCPTSACVHLCTSTDGLGWEWAWQVERFLTLQPDDVMLFDMLASPCTHTTLVASYSLFSSCTAWVSYRAAAAAIGSLSNSHPTSSHSSHFLHLFRAERLLLSYGMTIPLCTHRAPSGRPLQLLLQQEVTLRDMSAAAAPQEIKR